VFHLVRAEVNAAHAIAEDVLAWAEDHRDTAARSAGQQIAAMTSFYRGDLGSARTHQEALIAASDPERSIGQPVLYDWNARIVALSFLSYTLFVLGYPDQALGRSREAFAEAQKLSHPHTLTNPLRTACYLHHFCRERRAVQARAQELVALSTEHDYPYWLAIGTVFRGWAVAEGGGAEEGISELTRGLAAFQATHAVIALPYFLGLLADAYGGAGRAAEGLTVLARARTQVEATGERWFEPELHRMSGELFLSRAGGDDGQAEQSFHQALLSARQQNARAWELRAATSLARLWAGNGERRKAHDVLAPVYGWFTEGFDTADLKEARALLDELA
jgi:predicted ATPase